MTKSQLSFLLGLSLAAIVALWAKARSLRADNELLEIALAGVVASAFEDDEQEPLEEWGG